jgi:hypothetical protein
MTSKTTSFFVDLGWAVLIALVILIFLSLIGCASSRPIQPPADIEVEEVTTPVPCIYEIALLPVAEPPAIPIDPGDDASETEVKDWLADLKTAIGQRVALLVARVEAYEAKIMAHNSLTPKCSEIE